MLAKIFVALAVFAVSAFAKSSAKECALELQGIIHSPQTCKTDYFKRMAAAFPDEDPAFWTAVSTSSTTLFFALMKEFVTFSGLSVLITEETGTQTAFYFNAGAFTGTAAAVNLVTHDIDQAVLNLGSYTYNLKVTNFASTPFSTVFANPVDSYSFLAFNEDGTERTISLWAGVGSPNCFNLC